MLEMLLSKAFINIRIKLWIFNVFPISNRKLFLIYFSLNLFMHFSEHANKVSKSQIEFAKSQIG